MKSPAPEHSPGLVPPAPEPEGTGLPGLRSWPAVYALVIGVFVIVAGLLTVLTEMYS